MLDKIINLLKEKLKKIDNNDIGILYDFSTSQAFPDFKFKYSILEEYFFFKREDEELYPLRMDTFNIIEKKFSVVLGDFSSGKTYTAKQIYKILANGFIEPEMRYGYYPVLVDFASLAKEYKKCKNIFKAVALVSDYPLETLTAIVQEYDTVFIFDCIDDVASSVQTTLVNEILSNPYITYKKCIFTAYENGAYCECGRTHIINGIQMAKFKIEALRDKDVKNIIDSFSNNKFNKLFEAIIEMETALPQYKSLSRNISSLLGIISYYENNRSLPQNRLDLTEHFVEKLLLNKLNISKSELPTVKEYLGYKVTAKIYSALNDSLSNSKREKLYKLPEWTDNGSSSNIENLFSNTELEKLLNTSTIQAYLSAFYIFQSYKADDYSMIKQIGEASYSLINLVLEFLLLILDKREERKERILYALDLLQDTLKPNYDSIVQSVLYFKNYKIQAFENIVNAMLKRGVACISNPPETIIGAFSCRKDKVAVYDNESYCANPYEELFYYVVKYDLYDFISAAHCKNKIAKKLIQELIALNTQAESDIMELLDEYTDGFMAFLASEYRAGIPEEKNENPILKGHISSTKTSVDFYKKYLLDSNDLSVLAYAHNVRGKFCANNPYLTSIYIDEQDLPLSIFFKGNGNLKRIKVSKNNVRYYSENNCIIHREQKALILGCNASIIPNNVTTIEEKAFLNQQELTEIEIPDSVKEIRKYAFMYCTKLNRLILSKNLREVKESAFAFCTALKELHIPAKLKNCDSVFWALESLERISVDDKNQNYRVDNGCLIENSKNTVVATTANAQIPDSISAISNYAFAYNESLTELKIPETIKTIHNNAFYKCAEIKSLTIPKSTSSLGEKCFFGCRSIKKATIYAKLLKKHYALFAKCRALEEITITGSLNTAADRMFYGCISLKTINLPDDTLVIEKEFARDCRSLRKINLPNNLRDIGSNAFENTCLIELIVPVDVGVINNGTFKNCSYLREIKYLGQLFHVSKEAFKGCRALKNFSCENSDYIKSINDCLISPSNSSVYLAFPNSSIPSMIEKIDSCAYESRMGLREIVLGTNIKYIDSYAFANCFELKKLATMSVTEFGEGSFDGCVNLEEIQLGDSLKSIKYNVFKNCKALKSITIPQTVVAINQSCFKGCDSLEEINFSAQIRALQSGIFSSLKALKKVNFTYPIGRWRDSIFKNCTALEEYTIPDSVKEIGNACFEGCSSLKEVTLSANMKIIMPNTFKDCVSLKRLTIPASIEGICKAFENCFALDELIYLGTKQQWENILLDGSCSDIFEDLSTSIVKCIDGNAILR